MPLTAYFKKIVSFVPRGVWFLSLSNFFTNIASTIVIVIAPLFLTNVLNISISSLGFFEGVVESSALLARFFSGVLADWMKKYKKILVVASAMSILSRFLLFFSTTIWGVFGARVVDRLGNGMQASPRDALVGHLAPADKRGTCYGLRQALTVFGSVVGSGCAFFLLSFGAKNYSFMFLFAALPAMTGLIVLLKGVQEPPFSQEPSVSSESPHKTKPLFCWKEIANLPANYWLIVFMIFLFMCSHFSCSFLLIFSKEQGVPEVYLPFVLTVQCLFTTMAAIPLSKLADRVDRRVILGLGFIIHIASNVILALSGGNLFLLFLSIALWGINVGTQGAFLSAVSDVVPKHLLGTAFGIFHLVSGLGVFLANVVVSVLWARYSPQQAFLSITSISFLGILCLLRTKPIKPNGAANNTVCAPVSGNTSSN